jgi:hypothetical protein
MIVVRVELHSAITGIVTEIARCDIWNVASGDRDLGDYDCASYIGRSRTALGKRKTNRTGTVRGHARLRDHVLNLVAKALASMNYGKKSRKPDTDFDLLVHGMRPADGS